MPAFIATSAGEAVKAYADFSSSSALVIPALKTGNVDLVTNAMAREVINEYRRARYRNFLR